MQRKRPLTLAVLVLLLSLFFGITGEAFSQSPAPKENREQIIASDSIPAGITPLYVLAGQAAPVECKIIEEVVWVCALPIGQIFLEVPPDLEHIWEVVEAKSGEPVSIEGIHPFIAWLVLSSGELGASVCLTNMIETASDAWDFRCSLGWGKGSFLADFDPEGFIPQVVNPLKPEPTLLPLMPTVTPTPQGS